MVENTWILCVLLITLVILALVALRHTFLNSEGKKKKGKIRYLDKTKEVKQRHFI